MYNPYKITFDHNLQTRRLYPKSSPCWIACASYMDSCSEDTIYPVQMYLYIHQWSHLSVHNLQNLEVLGCFHTKVCYSSSSILWDRDFFVDYQCVTFKNCKCSKMIPQLTSLTEYQYWKRICMNYVVIKLDNKQIICHVSVLLS